jgi:hypothetical protein
MKNIKVGIDAFNDFAKSHDAHVKEVERLQKELNNLNNLKLVDQNGELLLECRIGDEYHQALLGLGITKLLEDYLKEGNLGSLKQLDCEGIDISAEKGKVNIVDIPGFEGTMDELEKLSLYSKDEIKKYGEKKYQEYKDSLSKDDKEYLENKYGKMK